MCVFAAKDSLCILQKQSGKNYEFKKTDIMRCLQRGKSYPEVIKRHLDELAKPYACYRVWELRERDTYLGPGDRVNHYSEVQSASSPKCRNKDGEFIVTNCPRFVGARLCEAFGWESYDPQCPLLHDPSFKLNGFLNILRNVVVPKEIAYKIRTISKRRIECDAAYNIAMRLTGKQVVLWWLKTLGAAGPDIQEMQVIADVGKTNFVNTLYGSPNKKGYRYGGAVSKVEKVLRHKGFDDRFIEWFCLEAFKLISLDFHRPALYLEAREKYPMVSLSDIEFGVCIDDNEDWACWTWKDKTKDTRAVFS